jgi:rod shape-determining protein MreD
MFEVSPNAMKAFQITIVLLAAFLAVFAEAALPGFRRVLGAQVDLLPALMVYAALNTSLHVVVLLAIAGGLMFDSLSANPLGVSILPYFTVGFLIVLRRDLILRDQLFAQFVLGFAASALAAGLSVLTLMTLGETPMIGWGSLWQCAVMSLGGGMATPVIFAVFGWINRVFGYQPIVESSFRPDREIRRGRQY